MIYKYVCVLGRRAIPALAIVCIGAVAAVADPASPAISSATAAAQSAPANAKPTPQPHITGFRSATFGSDEGAVREAIAKDFGVRKAAIRKSENFSDRTNVLTIRVPDVLSGGGTAEIAYVFGYTSKKLTQISVVWSRGTDKAMTAERLLANAESLKAYFQAQGYDPKSTVADVPVRDGILLFRGTDADGHTTALVLHGTAKVAADKTTSFAPSALFLFYVADPKAPDVFKIQAGRF